MSVMSFYMQVVGQHRAPSGDGCIEMFAAWHCLLFFSVFFWDDLIIVMKCLFTFPNHSRAAFHHHYLQNDSVEAVCSDGCVNYCQQFSLLQLTMSFSTELV